MSDILKYFSLQALCPLRDVPSHSNHGDPLSYYQTGDIIRGDQFHHINKKVTVVRFLFILILKICLMRVVFGKIYVFLC